jgi:HEAT repeat protein
MPSIKPLIYTSRLFGIFVGVFLGVFLTLGCGAKPPQKATSGESGDFRQLSDAECVKMLGHRNPLVRRQVVGELASRGARVVPKLIAELKRQGNHPAKSAAAEVLVMLGPAAREALPALTQVAEDLSWPDRYLAVRALGEIPASSEKAIQVLIQRLENDPEERVRAAAARSLGKISAKVPESRPKILPALLAATGDSDPTVIAEVAEALGLAGHDSPEVRKALEKLAGAQDFVVRQAAEEALKNLKKLP